MKKLIAGLLAITLTFGSFALPTDVKDGSISGSMITASAETYGDYRYELNYDGTVDITSYKGTGENIVIPATIDGYKVSGIYECAFENRNKIKSVTISNGVEHIGAEAFAECENLKSVTIPDSVTNIGNGAFQACSNLKTVVLPKNITEISERLFYDCYALEKITIPDGVTSIGSMAFENCSSIESMTLPSTVKIINDRAFVNCESLESVNIPYGITVISDTLFSCCSNLRSIDIPDTVTKIENSAFWGCSSLNKITIPSSVTTIEEGVFNFCQNLMNISVDADNANYSSDNGVMFNKNKTQLLQYPAGSIREKYYIPNTVTDIGSYAFYGSELSDIIIPSTVTNIEDYAFGYCENIFKLEIPESVKSVGSYAFSGCFSLSEITLPKSITSISDSMFASCGELEKIVIPNTVTSIGEYAFASCTSLKNITIPNSVKDIGNSAFCSCEALTSVVIPNSVTSIEDYVFELCSNLKSVTIPTSVKAIREGAFMYCTGLKSVNYYGSKTQWGKISIEESNDGLAGAKITYNYDPNHTHSYKTTVVAPTYTSQGYTLHKCSCGASYKDNYTARKTLSKVSVRSTYTYAPDAVRINWNKVNGASGYKVFMYNDSTKKWDVVGRIFNNNTSTFRKAGLKSGKAYKFKVQAFVKSGNNYYYGATSNTISTATSPATVKVSKSNSANDAVRIYWNKVSCSGYKVQQYNASSKKWVTIAKVSGTTTNYRVSGLKRKTSYKFRVQPYQANGAGGYSYGAVSNTYTAKTK